MKKVALISSFCDTHQKLEVLRKNIDILKGMDIDTLVISPFSLPDEIVNTSTYFFKTKDNPVLDWPERSMYSWSQISLNGESYRISRTYADYGWAGLFQVKQSSEIGLLLNYDQFFHIIYDLIIDDNVLNGLNSNKTCNIYPSKRDSDIWKVGLHFMVFDRENLKRFISNIHLDSYLSLRGADAFVWLHNLHQVFPYNYEEIPVEDEIYFYKDHDFYNYSPTDKFRMFIVKDDELKDTIKLLFYNLEEEKTISINVNSNVFDSRIYNYCLVDLNVTGVEFEKLEIIVDEITYDITEKIKQVKHNTLRKNE
jgi:hypothetical protein